MAKGTLTITLADGTQLGGLGMNGNNFFSKTEVTAQTFAGKLSRVVITGDAEADEADSSVNTATWSLCRSRITRRRHTGLRMAGTLR